MNKSGWKCWSLKLSYLQCMYLLLQLWLKCFCYSQLSVVHVVYISYTLTRNPYQAEIIYAILIKTKQISLLCISLDVDSYHRCWLKLVLNFIVRSCARENVRAYKETEIFICILIIFMLITRRKVGLITSLIDEGAVPLVSGTKI